MKRVLIGMIGGAACCLGIWQSARIGFARNLAEQAVLTNATVSADRAVTVLPNDAETHSVSGLILQRTGNYAEACRELERAIQLRPRDYFLWMFLGVSRDLNQEPAAALNALRQSVALAPAYAKPHWLLGNLLLRRGSIDEAMNELRIAASSDALLLPNVIDLAWGISRHDPAQTVNAVEPRTDKARMSLAIFFANHDQGPAAIDQFRSVQSLSGDDVHNLINALLKTRLFVEAYEVWTKVHHGPSVIPSLINAGFEDEITLGQRGFGWQVAENVASVTLSADPSQYQSGKKSLRIDFRGESNPAVAVVTQFVLVRPSTNYRLAFQASTKEFISPGAPLLTVTDASDEKETVLAQSSSISAASEWREFTLDFKTGEKTTTVRLGLVRHVCGSNPCAAFGTVWLDSFDLKALPDDSESRVDARAPVK
jgi:hypothetical protein